MLLGFNLELLAIGQLKDLLLDIELNMRISK